jgi:tRNA (cytidine/uridine-2'-O-)-methyltransferase
MFDIVLHAPEIPPNAGNVIRLAANTGCRLHMVEPLGFSTEDRQLRRAGLDYHDMATVTVHADWNACAVALHGRRMFAYSTRATAGYASVGYLPGDALVFGGETRGLPDQVLAQFDGSRQLRLPMRPANRSVNLSNAVAVVVYEAWRQNGFAGGA